jgi:hypothetical protein
MGYDKWADELLMKILEQRMPILVKRHKPFELCCRMRDQKGDDLRITLIT